MVYLYFWSRIFLIWASILVVFELFVVVDMGWCLLVWCVWYDLGDYLESWYGRFLILVVNLVVRVFIVYWLVVCL